MDTKCSREQVLRLPRTTREEVQFREQIEQRQILLHEDWPANAERQGLPQDATHVKHATETWAAFAARKEKQSAFLALNERVAEDESKKASAVRKASQERANAIIQKLADCENERRSKLLNQRHFLHVDFFRYQQFVFSKQRACVEHAEGLLRQKIDWAESELLFSLVTTWHLDGELQQVRERERLQNETLLRRLQDEERQRQAEEEKQHAVERLVKEREAAQAEKDQAELEKRLERKRREDERRAKAKAERERLKSL